jgi:hypothetical protein
LEIYISIFISASYLVWLFEYSGTDTFGIVGSFLNSSWMTLSSLLLLEFMYDGTTLITTKIILCLISILGTFNFILVIFLTINFYKEKLKGRKKNNKIYKL